MNERSELIAGYIPVIQQGYVDLFNRHKDATIGVFDTDILELFGYLKKDIRSLQPEIAVQAIEGMGRTTRFLGQQALNHILSNMNTAVFMPNDDVSHGLLHALDIPEDRVTFEPVFLRWDRQNTAVNMEIEPDSRINIHELNTDIIALLIKEQSESANSWRHVSAVLASGNIILGASHNHSLPTDYTGVIEGDPRNTANRGTSLEISNDIHAETELIATMAKNGQSIKGSELYVTTFPCPNCAKMIATAGIKSCFYTEGYAMVDGESVLKSAGVKLIKIDGFEPTFVSESLRTYPKSN